LNNLIKKDLLNTQKNLNNILTRLDHLPSLSNIYLEQKEIDLHRLVRDYGNTYDPLAAYFKAKFGLQSHHQFLSDFFAFISELAFKCYNQKTLEEYIDLLSGFRSGDKHLKKLLLYGVFDDEIESKCKSEYYHFDNNYPVAFIYNQIDDSIQLNPDILDRIEELEALELFIEHVYLFDTIKQNIS
jgi:hypothetical protein